MFPTDTVRLVIGVPLLLDRESLNTDYTNSQAYQGRYKVESCERSLRENIEDKNNADTLPNIEHGMLNRVEEREDNSEADDVIESMANRGDN